MARGVNKVVVVGNLGTDPEVRNMPNGGAAVLALKVGVTINSVKVQDTGYRWARCGKNKKIQFHWKCMVAPSQVIDYLTRT